MCRDDVLLMTRIALAGLLAIAVLWGGVIYAAINAVTAEQEPDW